MVKNGTFLHLEPQGLGEWDKYAGDVYFTTLLHHFNLILAPKTKKEHIFFCSKIAKKCKNAHSGGSLDCEEILGSNVFYWIGYEL